MLIQSLAHWRCWVILNHQTTFSKAVDWSWRYLGIGIFKEMVSPSCHSKLVYDSCIFCSCILYFLKGIIFCVLQKKVSPSCQKMGWSRVESNLNVCNWCLCEDTSETPSYPDSQIIFMHAFLAFAFCLYPFALFRGTVLVDWESGKSQFEIGRRLGSQSELSAVISLQDERKTVRVRMPKQSVGSFSLTSTLAFKRVKWPAVSYVDDTPSPNWLNDTFSATSRIFHSTSEWNFKGENPLKILPSPHHVCDKSQDYFIFISVTMQRMVLGSLKKHEVVDYRGIVDLYCLKQASVQLRFKLVV